jgi:hypothetical protein
LRLPVAATGVKVVEGTAYVTIDGAGSCRVSVFKGGCVEDVISLRGSPCALVWGSREGLLVSCGEVLYLVSGNEAKPVLRARSGNWFRHACEGDGRVFVQEYGEPPTGIYVTEDLKTFARVVTNLDIDSRSRHFHFVAFDGARGLLIATLGDGNLVRAAVSPDYGRTWRPVYRGPWQFVPALIEGGRWVFGFDSGVTRGGVGVYRPDEGEWGFIFLKSAYRLAQFASLAKLGDCYVGGLGLPTAIIASRDLRCWCKLHLGGGSGYNHFVEVAAQGDRVFAATGSELLVFTLKDVEAAFAGEPFLRPYGARLDRVRGALFLLRRLARP